MLCASGSVQDEPGISASILTAITSPEQVKDEKDESMKYDKLWRIQSQKNEDEENTKRSERSSLKLTVLTLRIIQRDISFVP